MGTFTNFSITDNAQCFALCCGKIGPARLRKPGGRSKLQVHPSTSDINMIYEGKYSGGPNMGFGQFSGKQPRIQESTQESIEKLRQSTADFATTPRHENLNQSVSVTYDAPVPKQSYQSPVRQLSEATAYDAPSYNIGNPNQSSFSIANSIDSLSNVITNANRDNMQQSLTITQRNVLAEEMSKRSILKKPNNHQPHGDDYFTDSKTKF